MIIDKIIKLLAKKYAHDIDDLVGGLVWGLVWGLVGSLMWGLASGFSALMLEIHWTSQFGLLIIIGVTILIVAEIFFWLDKKQPRNNQSYVWFTVKRKLIALGEASFFVSLACGAYQYVAKGAAYLSQNAPTIVDFFAECWVKILCSVIVVMLIVVGVVVWVYANSLKYRGQKK